ncbi:response regulator transcription factor [Streptomyces sp. SLBN-8D4]|uniref:response regulator transcription factor n=1 Tax=Streptomyces sp. SLBN-8D4 TaxID=3377728 RepID=UPI003C7B5E39
MYGSDVRVRPALAHGAGQHLLLIVHEPGVAELLSTTLKLAGYRTTLTGTGSEALERLSEQRFDLMIVDTSLPDMAGLSRERPVLAHRPPALLLTEYDSLDDLVPELGPGERDYVTKPFRVAEVLARVQVLLRDAHLGRPRDGSLSYRDLVLEDTLRQARRGTRPLALTPAEYRLLRHLLVNAHQVLSKEQIGRYVWGDHRGDNSIEQLVSRLRRKVDRDAPSLIHTRRGFGYWLGHAEDEH